MMYWATWVQVTERMPPRTEQNKTPIRPTKTPILKSMPMNRETIRPTPVTWAIRYVKEQRIAASTPMMRAAEPPYRADRKSGMV